ncbi:MAG: hypothetical protein DMD61_05780 [Gemmatimonadetes bacterium]|nr:MAG: hypothetical protein DMD61_05780 [Gemmatimonadota bacterium]
MDRELILDVRSVSYRYPGAPADALEGVNLAVRAGEVHAVLGPNGSGKTTLVRVALGLARPAAGSVMILGRPAGAWSRRAIARVVGVVAQREDNLFPQRVRETVLLGRYAYLSLWGTEAAEDHAAVDRALARCDVSSLANRWIWTLSGGEYQRVRLARALAQEPKLLRFADRVLLLADGRPAGAGAPADVLTRETVERVFAWPVSIASFEGRPQMIPLRHGKDEI